MPKLPDAILDAVGTVLGEQIGRVTARLAEVAEALAVERAARLELARSLEIIQGGEPLAPAAVERIARMEGATETLKALIGVPGPRGEPGPAGRDGNLDQFSLTILPTPKPREFVLVMRSASGVEARADFAVPSIIYQGIYQHGIDYQAGDCVTVDGSMWVALSETGQRPGTDAGRASWRLAVKRGRDLKEAAA